jgi:hypothetical protein
MHSIISSISKILYSTVLGGRKFVAIFFLVMFFAYWGSFLTIYNHSVHFYRCFLPMFFLHMVGLTDWQLSGCV